MNFTAVFEILYTHIFVPETEVNDVNYLHVFSFQGSMDPLALVDQHS
jgi:hypothetical protein